MGSSWYVTYYPNLQWINVFWKKMLLRLPTKFDLPNATVVQRGQQWDMTSGVIKLQVGHKAVEFKIHRRCSIKYLGAENYWYSVYATLTANYLFTVGYMFRRSNCHLQEAQSFKTAVNWFSTTRIGVTWVRQLAGNNGNRLNVMIFTETWKGLAISREMLRSWDKTVGLEDTFQSACVVTERRN
jgi:hypothetical protein